MDSDFKIALETFYGNSGYPRNLSITTRSFPTDLQARAITAMFETIPEGPILDMGCGHGRMLSPLSNRTGRTVIGIDVVEECCRIASNVGNVICADSNTLPLRNGTAAAAISLFTSIGYDNSPISAFFDEVSRVLLPGGRFFIDSVRPGRRGAVKFEESLNDGERALVKINHTDDSYCNLLFTVGRGFNTGYYELAYRAYCEDELIEAADHAGFKLLKKDFGKIFTISVENRNTLLFQRL